MFTLHGFFVVKQNIWKYKNSVGGGGVWSNSKAKKSKYFRKFGKEMNGEFHLNAVQGGRVISDTRLPKAYQAYSIGFRSGE